MYTKEQANFIVDNLSECIMESHSDIVYLGSILDSSIEAPKNYLIETGIYKEDHIIPTTRNLDIPEHCTRKFTENPNFIIPKGIDDILNSKIIGCNIIPVGRITPQNISKHVIRPMCGGIKISSDAYQDITYGEKSGTLGALFKLKRIDAYYLLTNYHSIAKENIIYDDLIFQPDNILNDYTNLIGRVHFGKYGHTKTNYFGNNIKTIDAIFVQLDQKQVALNDLFKGNHFYTKGFVWSKYTISNSRQYVKQLANSFQFESVHYYGQSSKKSKGFVRSTNATVKVDNAYDSTKSIYFKNQIISQMPNLPGDSGSVLMNSNKEAIGLHHAGDGKNIAISNNINHIFDATYLSKRGTEFNIELEFFLT